MQCSGGACRGGSAGVGGRGGSPLPHFAFCFLLSGLVWAYWRQLRPIWRQLGPSWRQLGPTWRELVQTWTQLAPIWGQLGPSSYQLGVNVRHLGPKRSTRNVKNHCFSLVFVYFIESRASCNLGVHLGATWTNLRLTLDNLGRTWDQVGTNFDSMGANLGHLGAILG